jgi:hypothetical protein
MPKTPASKRVSRTPVPRFFMSAISPVRPSTLSSTTSRPDFSKFEPVRVLTPFAPVSLEGKVGGQELAIVFNHFDGPDRVFARIGPRGSGSFVELTSDEMRTILPIAERYRDSLQGGGFQDEKHYAGVLVNLVRNAAQLTDIRAAYVRARDPGSARGDMVNAEEAKAQLDAALADGKIDVFENAVLLVGMSRALAANKIDQGALNTFYAAQNAGQMTYSTDVEHYAFGERILNGTPAKPDPIWV